MVEQIPGDMGFNIVRRRDQTMSPATCYSDMDKRWIILYDGYCNLCSRAVQWIVRNDRKRRFTFVPLQHAGGWEELRKVYPDRDLSATSASMPTTSSGMPPKDSGVPSKASVLPPEARFSEDTVLFWMEGKLYSRSTAALRIAMKLRFPWPLLGVFLLVPRFIRDPVYNFVARNRVRWFGRRHTCYLP